MVDEFNQFSLRSAIKWKKERKSKAEGDTPPPMDHIRSVLFMGAILKKRVILAGQDLNHADLFGLRPLFGTALLFGWRTRSWNALGDGRMPRAPSAKQKGRGVINRGDEPEWLQAVCGSITGASSDERIAANDGAWRVYALAGRVPSQEVTYTARQWWGPVRRIRRAIENVGGTVVRPALPPGPSSQLAIGRKQAAAYLGITEAKYKSRRDRYIARTGEGTLPGEWWDARVEAFAIPVFALDEWHADEEARAEIRQQRGRVDAGDRS